MEHGSRSDSRDDALKARVDEPYSTLGRVTATAVRMFFVASLERDGIPFDVRRTPDYSLEQREGSGPRSSRCAVPRAFQTGDKQMYRAK